MKVRDKELRKDIDVSCKDCPKYKCYWPRPHPGVFNQGSGYSKTADMKRGDEKGIVDVGQGVYMQALKALRGDYVRPEAE